MDRTETYRGTLGLDEARRMSASDLAAARRRGIYPPLAGGDQALLESTKKRVAEIDGDLAALRDDAGAKFRKMQDAQKAIADHDGKVDVESDLFTALETSGKDYDDTSEKIAGLTTVKAGLVASMLRQGIAAPPADEELVDDRKAILPGDRGETKTPGQRVIESPDYKALVASGALNGDTETIGAKRLGDGLDRAELKAALTGASPTSGGAFVNPDRVGYFPMLLRPITVLDMVTVGQTNSDLIEYVKQSMFTNAAAPVAEATTDTGTSGTKPQSTLGFTKVQTGVKTIAHWVAATRRALADAGQLETIVDGLLRYGLDIVLENQVVSGNGVGENLTGILSTSGINAVPAGAQTHEDKAHFAMTAIRLDNIEPKGFIFHPTDWETIRLRKEGGTNNYIFGAPSVAGPETLWGKPVAITAAVPQGTALAGDFRAYTVWLREGAQVLASDSHLDFFVRNLIAILAEMRAAGGVIYPDALCSINLAAS